MKYIIDENEVRLRTDEYEDTSQRTESWLYVIGSGDTLYQLLYDLKIYPNGRSINAMDFFELEDDDMIEVCKLIERCIKGDVN